MKLRTFGRGIATFFEVLSEVPGLILGNNSCLCERQLRELEGAPTRPTYPNTKVTSGREVFNIVKRGRVKGTRAIGMKSLFGDSSKLNARQRRELEVGGPTFPKKRKTSYWI